MFEQVMALNSELLQRIDALNGDSESECAIPSSCGEKAISSASTSDSVLTTSHARQFSPGRNGNAKNNVAANVNSSLEAAEERCSSPQIGTKYCHLELLTRSLPAQLQSRTSSPVRSFVDTHGTSRRTPSLGTPRVRCSSVEANATRFSSVGVATARTRRATTPTLVRENQPRATRWPTQLQSRISSPGVTRSSHYPLGPARASAAWRPPPPGSPRAYQGSQNVLGQGQLQGATLTQAHVLRTLPESSTPLAPPSQLLQDPPPILQNIGIARIDRQFSSLERHQTRSSSPCVSPVRMRMATTPTFPRGSTRARSRTSSRERVCASVVALKGNTANLPVDRMGMATSRFILLQGPFAR